MKCENGCNNEALFITKSGKHICCRSSNQCPVNRLKNSTGLKKAYKDGIREKKCIFTNEHREMSIQSKKLDAKERFRSNTSPLLSNKSIKVILFDHYNRGIKCECCGIEEWMSKPITLELDHIDGDSGNNVIENFQLLCPNCHSQTDTFRGRNKNTGKKKVADDDLIEALKIHSNIRQALISVGLSPRGGNYSRASKLLHQCSI